MAVSLWVAVKSPAISAPQMTKSQWGLRPTVWGDHASVRGLGPIAEGRHPAITLLEPGMDQFWSGPLLVPGESDAAGLVERSADLAVSQCRRALCR